MKKIIFLLLLFIVTTKAFSQFIQTDVLIVGGSASGVAAGIQSARLGVKTVIIEEITWLGGALTAAGMSATEGNDDLSSGLWAEFRDSLSVRYGSTKALATGWASKTSFEPKVGADIFKNMTLKESYLKVLYETKFQTLKRINPSRDAIPNIEGGWSVTVKDKKGKTTRIETRILIDATELGDVAKVAGVRYRIGTDDPTETGEEDYAVKKTNIVQDMTYVAILKDYGGNAPAIAKPQGYNAADFDCSCGKDCSGEKVIGCDKMLDFGKLPNDKYIINWRTSGNDYYANIIDTDEKTRQKAYDEAQKQTMRFLYYIQQELEYKNLGLAEDEFPTADKLPFYPYQRESRRTEGVVTLTLNHLLKPFEQQEPLYRTGIAVGDFPIDPHHARNKGKIPEWYVPKISAYNIPLGSLIPKDLDDFIIAEKSISVTNIVSATTGTQPCVMLIGQAAGVLAAVCVKENKSTKKVSIRSIQEILLDNKAYLMPYYDVKLTHPFFNAIQRVGATGILRGRPDNLRGRGEASQAVNRTAFDPDSLVTMKTFYDAFSLFSNEAAPTQSPSFPAHLTNTPTVLKTDEAIELLWHLGNVMNINLENYPNIETFKKTITNDWSVMKLGNFDKNKPIKRSELALLLDFYLNPFQNKEIDLRGHFK